MKRLVFGVFMLSFLVTLPSCSKKHNITLGFTAAHIPITLSIDSYFQPHISFSAGIVTPLGTFFIADTPPELNRHVTYVEIINRHENNKYRFRLDGVDESVQWNTKNSHITVTNRSYSTVVTVESDEISNLLHEKNGPGFKPSFPETPWQYFCLFKALKLDSKERWEIRSGHVLSDLGGDLFFVIISFLVIIIDLIIIVVVFFFCFLIWIFLLLGNLIGIV